MSKLLFPEELPIQNPKPSDVFTVDEITSRIERALEHYKRILYIDLELFSALNNKIL